MNSLNRNLKSGPMRPLTMITCILMTCLITATQAFADTSVDRMLRASGYDRQLDAAYDSVPEQFALNFQQSSGLSVGTDIKKIVENSLSSEEIYKTTVNRLQAKLSVAQIDEVMVWLNSALGRKITELEVRASHADHIEKMSAQLNSLFADAVLMKRGSELDRLMEVTDQTMLQVEFFQVAMLNGMMGNRASAAEKAALKSQMTQGLQQARPQVQQTTQAMVGYTYRSISDREYESYREYLSTPVSKTLHKYVVDAHTEVAQRQFETLGRNLASYLQNLQSAQARR